jgi:hypothetical protein
MITQLITSRRSELSKTALTHLLVFAAGICIFLFPSQTAYAQATRASVILSPDPGSTFPSSSVTFVWEDVNATGYILRLGTSEGALDIHNSGLITGTSRMVTGLPTSTVVHATLWTRMGTGSSYSLRYFVYNIDLDDDGIEDAIDPNPGFTDPKVSSMGEQNGEDYILTILGSGRVASLEVSQTLYDALITPPVGAPPHMTLLSKMVFNELRDRFEFLIFVSDEDSFTSGLYSGIHGGAKNDTAGIGRPLFDSTGNYGSAGNLESVIHLPSKLAIAGGPSLHEIMHRWGNYNYIQTTVSSHWGYSNIGGQLGGWAHGTLESLGGNLYSANNGRTSSFGTFANGGNAQPFGPLELYLMGLIEAAEVHDIQRAVNPAPTATAGQFTADSIETRTMAQMIAQHGARLPAAADSKKVFTALWVVVTTGPLSNGRWASYDRDVYDVSFPGVKGASSMNFWEATGGLAQLKSHGVLEAAKTFLPVANISDFSIRGSDAFVQFFGDSGVTYRLQHSEALDVWEAVGPEVVGTDHATGITHMSGAAGQRGFYRLQYELESPAPPVVSAQSSPLPDSTTDCTACIQNADHVGGFYHAETLKKME